MVDGSGKHNFLGFKELTETAWAPDVETAFFVESSTMVAGCDWDDIIQLSDESGMALIDLVPDTQLTILVISHAIHLSLGSEEQRVEHSALNLLYFMAEIDQQGSGYLFRLVDSQLSVFVWAGSIDISVCINEPAMHGSAWKMRNLPFDEHLGGSRPGFKLSGSQRAVVSQSPRVQLIVHQLDTNMREAAFNF